LYSIIAISRSLDVNTKLLISLYDYVQDDDRLLLRKYVIMGIMRRNFIVI